MRQLEEESWASRSTGAPAPSADFEAGRLFYNRAVSIPKMTKAARKG